MADPLTPAERRRLAENGWYPDEGADEEGRGMLSRMELHDSGGGQDDPNFDPSFKPKPSDYTMGADPRTLPPREMATASLQDFKVTSDDGSPRVTTSLERGLPEDPVKPPAPQKYPERPPAPRMAMREATIRPEPEDAWRDSMRGTFEPERVQYARTGVQSAVQGQMAKQGLAAQTPEMQEDEYQSRARWDAQQQAAMEREKQIRAEAFKRNVMARGGVPSMPSQIDQRVAEGLEGEARRVAPPLDAGTNYEALERQRMHAERVARAHAFYEDVMRNQGIPTGQPGNVSVDHQASFTKAAGKAWR